MKLQFLRFAAGLFPFAIHSVPKAATSPPRYPSPWMDGSGGWADAYSRAQAFVRQLTLLEKVNLTTGTGWQSDACVGNTGAIPRLGFPSLCMQDSPLGVRFGDYVSAFPAGGTVAASWDRNVFYARGYEMGMEHRRKGVDVQLGPVVGPLGRKPKAGRNWEGFSPDPVLSGIAVASTVKGTQDAGVIACTKHYILNEQEHFRSPGGFEDFGSVDAISANVDDKTLHELYLWPFADAVRAGTGSVMCSYNNINNSLACQNSYLMNGLLKDELGFQGFIMSDWGAQYTGMASALAGLDMTMPGDASFSSENSFWGTNLTVAVLNGTLPEWRLDDMATRIMAAYYYVGRDGAAEPTNFNSWATETYGYSHYYGQAGYGLINQHVDVREEHANSIRSAAARSTVLLKNSKALPLTGTEKFTGVFGEDAEISPLGPNGCSDRGCDNGNLAMGWGSGTTNFPYLVSPLTAIQNEVLANGGMLQSVTDSWNLDAVATLAKQVSTAIVFVNADSGEGFLTVDGNAGDRNNLTLWKNGDALIKNLTGRCNNTIVVIHSVGPVLMDQWYDNPNVTAILWAGLPGQESGNAIVDVLYGRVNPGGKLPFTMGRKESDYGADIIFKPTNGHDAPQDAFTEGVFIDYRWFDKNNITPTYEFGYGLSYTSFSYSNLSVTVHSTGNYSATVSETQAAPVLSNSSTNAAEYQWPANLTYVKAYIYPYLNSTSLKTASNDSDYGLADDKWLPHGAADGSAQRRSAAGGGPGGNAQLYDVVATVQATVTNTGPVAGDEVAQLYLSLGGPDDPKVVLRNFARLSVGPGQSAVFSADVTRRDVSSWDVVSQNWAVSRHAKTVYVGSSSRALPLSAPLGLL